MKPKNVERFGAGSFSFKLILDILLSLPYIYSAMFHSRGNNDV